MDKPQVYITKMIDGLAFVNWLVKERSDVFSSLKLSDSDLDEKLQDALFPDANSNYSFYDYDLSSFEGAEHGSIYYIIYDSVSKILINEYGITEGVVTFSVSW